MSSDDVLLGKSIDAHIDAVRENTRELQSLRLDMTRQTSLFERQTIAMEKMAISVDANLKRIDVAERGILEKLGSLITSMKVQWALMATGIIPVLYFLVVKNWNTGG